MRDTNVPDDLLDNFKNIDVDAAFDPFIYPLDSQLTDIEVGLKNELKMLKQMKKVLNELNQKITIQRVKPEEKPKPAKTTEKAKEAAMKLLKSGAISFENASDRYVFKRKTKEYDEYGYEPEEIPVKNKKPNLYDSFVYGEKMNSAVVAPSNKFLKEPTSMDSTSIATLGFSLDPDDHQNDVKAYNTVSNHKVPPPIHQSYQEDYSNRKSKTLTIYISCNDINESLIREILEPYGPIANIRLDELKCYGFVTLKSTEMVEKALQLDRTRHGNHRLRVNYARRQYNPPPLPPGEPEPSDRQNQQHRPYGGQARNNYRKMEPLAPQSDASLRNLVDYGDVDQ